MRIATKIWDSGWGALFLTIYAFLVVHLVAPQQHLLKSFAILPTVLVMFLVDRYSFWLIHFFAGDKLQQSTEQIERITGEQDFYEAASNELQARIDDLDRRAYQNNISILSGILIAVSIPFVGFYLREWVGAVGGLIVAVLAVQLLSRRSIRQINTLAQNITEPYTAKYEN